MIRILIVACAALFVVSCGLLWGLNNRIAAVNELKSETLLLRNTIKHEQQIRDQMKRQDALKEKLYADQAESLKRIAGELASLRKRTRTAIEATPDTRDWGHTPHPTLINCLLSRTYRAGGDCPSNTPSEPPHPN